MRLTVVAASILALFFSGCGSNSNPGCGGAGLLEGQAVYVANTGSNSISVFDTAQVPICTGAPGSFYYTWCRRAVRRFL